MKACDTTFWYGIGTKLEHPPIQLSQHLARSRFNSCDAPRFAVTSHLQLCLSAGAREVFICSYRVLS